MRDKLLDQLKRHEGTKRDASGLHIAYRCTAEKLTIGYGHNLDANPVPGVGDDSKLTEDQATRLLDADVSACERDVLKSLPWAVSLSYARYAVLVNMCFNLGINGLLGFNNTLRMVKAGNYAGAARGMLASRWAGQVGNRAQELARQMETGAWK